MLRHVLHEAPWEACGFVAGRGDKVDRIYEMENLERSDSSYFISPRQRASAMRDMERRGLRLLAIYHSHIESPAYPSLKDREAAVEKGVLHVIVSLANSGRVPVVRAFSITDGAVKKSPLMVVREE
jgi:proteasome lid subunit RPN8/RPN11